MIISHRHKFIFFACGKTGTRSIEEVIKKYHNGVEIIKTIDAEQQKLRDQYSMPFNLKHVRPAFVKERIDPEIWNNYFRFVFVRNPWAWVLSNYCFNHPHLIRHLNRFDAVHVNLVWHLMKIHNQSFYTESYFQHTFVYDEFGLQLVDFYGKLENIQEDFNFICSKIGIKPKKMKKRNTTNHLPYRELYTDEAREMVAELYKKDIELFGYSF
jgi:hypothetical protein